MKDVVQSAVQALFLQATLSTIRTIAVLSALIFDPFDNDAFNGILLNRCSGVLHIQIHRRLNQ